jgi:hypothetical protein
MVMSDDDLHFNQDRDSISYIRILLLIIISIVISTNANGCEPSPY